MLVLRTPGKFRLRMNSEIHDRLQKLEAHVTHLEHQLEQLNEVVVEQGTLIGRLKKEVQRQAESLQTQMLEGIKSNPQKPPHYQ